jgi:hypothetical protein
MKFNNQSTVNIEFAPGCFDDFEGPQNELDELISSIREIFTTSRSDFQVTEVDIDQQFHTRSITLQ